jgi:phosphoglycolate phosphatase
MRRVDVAVFDLDNTLYDWYVSFVPAFYAMLDVAIEVLKCNRETLLDELRNVHIAHHDVEHPFSLLETPTVQRYAREVGASTALRSLDPAFHAFNRTRKYNLSLFPNALSTLEELRARGIRLVAFTDSSYFATLRRVRQLNLIDIFEHIYCRARSEAAPGLPVESSSALPTDNLPEIMIQLPANESKPDPRVLREIASIENIKMSSMAYIGDSITKDMLMAKNAGCLAIWARYGTNRDNLMYEQLVRISHWTAEDIQREKNFAREAADIAPDYICETSISELLPLLVGPY